MAPSSVTAPAGVPTAASVTLSCVPSSGGRKPSCTASATSRLTVSRPPSKSAESGSVRLTAPAGASSTPAAACASVKATTPGSPSTTGGAETRKSAGSPNTRWRMSELPSGVWNVSHTATQAPSFSAATVGFGTPSLLVRCVPATWPFTSRCVSTRVPSAENSCAQTSEPEPGAAEEVSVKVTTQPPWSSAAIEGVVWSPEVWSLTRISAPTATPALV